MKQLNQYITEYIIKKKLDKPIDSEDHCIYFPETKEELISNIKELFDKGKTDLNSIDTSKILAIRFFINIPPFQIHLSIPIFHRYATIFTINFSINLA